jgi:hypothetical protein
MKTRLLILLLVFSLALLPSQVGQARQAPVYTPPPIPLYIAISFQGEISLTSGLLKIPSLIVQTKNLLDASALSALASKTLVVRLNGLDTLYDLHDRSVRLIQFDRGYYQASRLQAWGNALLLETQKTYVMNEKPNASLVNETQVTTETGRRSCFESAFKSGMIGFVSNPVRLRAIPLIPDLVELNWIGSLWQGEKLLIRDRYCNAGVWLRVERSTGTIGWAKEWGLSEELKETTFIAPPPP